MKIRTPSTKALIATGATLAVTGSLVALAAVSTPKDNSGKTFASKALVTTTIKTKSRTVHVKRTVKRVRPAATGVAATTSFDASAASGSGAAAGAGNGPEGTEPVESIGSEGVSHSAEREWEHEDESEDERESEHEDREWEHEDGEDD